MSQVVESLVRQRMRIAAIAAGWVAAVLIAQSLISTVEFVLIGYSQQLDTGIYLGWIWQSVVNGTLVLLAFAFGAGVSLWGIAPITGELASRRVVVRGLLAAGVGAVLVFVVHLGLGLTGPLAGTGSLFGNSFPALNWGGIWQAASMALQAGVGAFVRQAPVVVLVVLLVWIWLARHPSRHAVPADTADV